MIEPRIYRAAFLPALFALVLVAFSLESPPRALEQGPAADVLFEGSAARERVRQIVRTAPDRRAGSQGNQQVATRVEEIFEASGFTTTVDRFEEDGRDLVNVVGRRPGDSTDQIVVLAARDSDQPPDAPGSAADTAALMEYARVFEGRALERTLVLASVDGAELGDAGARRFAAELVSGEVEAVIVLSDLGASRSRGPLVVGWSNSTVRAGVALQRTLAESLRLEIDAVPSQPGTPGQFARLAFPVAPGAQGVLLDRGFDAVRAAGAGETGDGGGNAIEDLGVGRYGALGRGVLRMIGTLDAARRAPERGDRTYLTVGGMQLPGWVLALLAVALVVPALVTSIDALARARRRREPVAPWLAWIGASAVPFLVALLVVWLMALVGLIRDAPPAPLDPGAVELDAAAIGAVVLALLVAILAWVLVRTRVVRRARDLPDASAPGPACAASLALSLLVLAIALFNPFAALVLVPALHLWMLATLTDVPARASVVMAAIGLLPLLAVAAYLMVQFQLGPPRALWYLLLLATGNQTGLLTTLAGCALLGIMASVALILFARARAGAGTPRPGDRAPAEPRQTIFGPGGHAGPGMLGGTTSSGARR